MKVASCIARTGMQTLYTAERAIASPIPRPGAGHLAGPLPRAQSASEKELAGASSGLREDGFEVVAGGVLGHHDPRRYLVGIETLAEQRQDFGLASRQSAG